MLDSVYGLGLWLGELHTTTTTTITTTRGECERECECACVVCACCVYTCVGCVCAKVRAHTLVRGVAVVLFPICISRCDETVDCSLVSRMVQQLCDVVCVCVKWGWKLCRA